METKISTENGRAPVTVIHVDGNIDSGSYEKFQAQANDLITNGARRILVDLTHAKFVSSAGLRALHDLFTQLRALDTDSKLSEEDVRNGINAGTYKSPHLKLLNLSPEARVGFETAGFDMFIETFTDMKTAVASF
ncbi:MAG: STAS domain-containing protein [Anaerolineales bacterium]|nr:MAG: STAS domain-containing protein [Anaerolineales bacterium]